MSESKKEPIISRDLGFLNGIFMKEDKWRVIPLQNGDYEILSGSDLYQGDVKQFNLDMIYLEMSQVWSKNSKCKRAQVGCIMVKNKSIISDGYNGSPTGFPNECEDEDNNTKAWVLHAEANAITKLSKSTLSSDGSTLYVTLSPCFECSKLIIQSGIRRVVFTELYRKTESIPFLLQGGIEIVKL
jgi:dCMP deaminase